MSEENIKDEHCANCSLYYEEGTGKCNCVSMGIERERLQIERIIENA